VLGAFAAATTLSGWAAQPVNYVVTAPGRAGHLAAFVAEFVISFILMTVILHVSNTPRLHKLTAICAGLLVAIYITVEAPISGMSMNPARTFASAVQARYWQDLWIYSPRRLSVCCRPRKFIFEAPVKWPAPSCTMRITSTVSFAESRRLRLYGASQKRKEPMKIKTLLGISGRAGFPIRFCGSVQVGRDVQAERNRLQTNGSRILNHGAIRN
jgi:hypothetical protein